MNEYFYEDVDTELFEDEFLDAEEYRELQAAEWEQGRREREADLMFSQYDDVGNW